MLGGLGRCGMRIIRMRSIGGIIGGIYNRGRGGGISIGGFNDGEVKDVMKDTSTGDQSENIKAYKRFLPITSSALRQNSQWEVSEIRKYHSKLHLTLRPTY